MCVKLLNHLQKLQISQKFTWHFMSNFFFHIFGIELIHVCGKSCAIAVMKENQRPVNAIIAVEIANADENSRTIIPLLRAFLENWNRWEEGEKWKKRDEVDLARISLVDSRTVNEARVKTRPRHGIIHDCIM